MDIAEAIQAKGYEIDRRRLVLKDAIKHTGEYTVGWKLHREVTVEIPVTVTAEGGEAPTADAAKDDAKLKKKAEAPVEEAPKESVEEVAETTETAGETEEKSE